MTDDEDFGAQLREAARGNQDPRAEARIFGWAYWAPGVGVDDQPSRPTSAPPVPAVPKGASVHRPNQDQTMSDFLRGASGNWLAALKNL